jgi:TPP-dependent 2-oxoacid decarboxylase
MKSFGLAVLILSGALAAQTSAPAQGTAGTPPPQEHMMAMQQHMQEMQAQMTKMKTNVEQMKANAAKIQDPAAKQQAELDAEMWQMMVDHMQSMQKMMSEHQGGMMHGGMHHMHHPGPKGTPPPSTPPQ